MKSAFGLQVCIFALFLSVSLQALEWSEQERENLKQYSLISHRPSYTDPSNQYLNNSNAIQLGEQLFNDHRLSKNKMISCASCHIETKSFTDNRMVARGIRKGYRNTPTLLNIAAQNWFFWDGGKDSLWAQAMSSIENPSEQGFSRIEVLRFIANDPYYRKAYKKLFRQALPNKQQLKSYPEKGGPNGNISVLKAWKKLSRKQKNTVDQVFSNIGKAIAAYVATIVSPPTRFDYFVEQLSKQGRSQKLTEAEQKGLKLFMSKRVGCSNCHSQAIFSNKEFHNIGTGIPGIDNGRSEVIDAVIRDDFNCLGNYSDASEEQCMELLYANTDRHTLAGNYKTPTLRSISKTAPYMHDGRYNNLADVLKYYNSIDKDKAERTDLVQINLNEEEEKNIIAFLKCL